MTQFLEKLTEYNNAVNSGIKLLKKIAEHERKGKFYDFFPNVAFGHKGRVFISQTHPPSSKNIP